MKRKVTKESFQGEEETEGFLFPLKITPISFLMGIDDSVYNRDSVGHKRVTAIALRDSLLPVGLLCNGANIFVPTPPRRNTQSIISTP